MTHFKYTFIFPEVKYPFKNVICIFNYYFYYYYYYYCCYLTPY